MSAAACAVWGNECVCTHRPDWVWCRVQGAGCRVCRVVARLVHEIAAASVLNVIPRSLVNIGLNADVYSCVSVCEIYRVYRQGMNQFFKVQISEEQTSFKFFLTLFYYYKYHTIVAFITHFIQCLCVFPFNSQSSQGFSASSSSLSLCLSFFARE